MKIGTETTWTQVSAGFRHSAGVRSGKTVWTWGYNAFGQLGDGTVATQYTPVQVSALSGVTAIAADYDVSIALKSDGTVWTWGNCGSLVPVKVSGLSGVTAIAGGKHRAIAMKSDGTAWNWGRDYGLSAPARVSGLTGVTAIAGGDAALALMPFFFMAFPQNSQTAFWTAMAAYVGLALGCVMKGV